MTGVGAGGGEPLSVADLPEIFAQPYLTVEALLYHLAREEAPDLRAEAPRRRITNLRPDPRRQG